MPLMLVGLNHRTAPVEVRERFSMDERKMDDILQQLMACGRLHGVAMLSTCNRVEAIISAPNEDVIEQIVDWMAGRAGAARVELEKHLYILRYGDVVKHLFRVCSGLDSMIVGEPQIGGQVRKAFQLAQDGGTLDALLTQLYEQTMRVAKRVRTDTGIGEHAVSVPYAAVELAKKIFGELEGLQVLLLGAGEIGELTAEHLHGQDVKQVFVANRSYERAAELATRFEGLAVQFDSIDEHLATCDIVIASTGAPHFVVEPEQVQRALATLREAQQLVNESKLPESTRRELLSRIDSPRLPDSTPFTQ